jgi:hypothetical protein
LLAHIGLCVGLQWRLRDRTDLLRELFAVPNEALTRGSNTGIRLLRARYYLPWVHVAGGKAQLDTPERMTLLVARMTGLFVPVACLVFFVGSFVQAT